VRIADELQASGGYVPGLRPGQATAEYLDKVMTQITFAGAMFLTALALTPTILISQTAIFGSDHMLASFFGGTSLLIVVGVTLDTMKQVETMLMNHNYAGFLTKGQLRSRRG
jgi:preprotein translocase subunit SecY